MQPWILELDADGYGPRDVMIESICTHWNLADSPLEVMTRYRARVVELTRPTTGAIECLEALRKAGHPLVIVTNGSTKQQHAKVDAQGFRQLVDQVVVSEEVGLSKPDPAIFELAANLTGATLHNAWMIGDSPKHDIVGAAVIGINTAWLRRDRSWDHPSIRPTVSIDTLTELPGLIRTT
jgi:putative hydrolase of the HAD superfamily